MFSTFLHNIIIVIHSDETIISDNGKIVIKDITFLIFNLKVANSIIGKQGSLPKNCSYCRKKCKSETTESNHTKWTHNYPTIRHQLKIFSKSHVVSHI